MIFGDSDSDSDSDIKNTIDDDCGDMMINPEKITIYNHRKKKYSRKSNIFVINQ